MARPHFYKARSRLGVKFVPIHANTLNLGVEEGPDAVLDPAFVGQFPGASVSDFRFSSPDDVDDNCYSATVAQESHALARLINMSLGEGEAQVVIGGDHSVAFASLIALLQRFPLDEIGYIQFDSHGDSNTLASSPTQNFHGMFLRPFLTQFDDPIIEAAVPHKLLPGSVLFVGNLELDPEEKRLFHELNLTNIPAGQLRQAPVTARHQLEDFVARFRHIHVSFDIDVFDGSVVSSTGTPSLDGLFPAEVMPLLSLLSHVPSLSIDLVEVNPCKPDPAPTIELAHQVLSSLLSRGLARAIHQHSSNTLNHL